jgi:hypothetical protein
MEALDAIAECLGLELRPVHQPKGKDKKGVKRGHDSET